MAMQSPVHVSERVGAQVRVDDGARYDVRDLGGLNNTISLGPHIGFSEGSYVELGPGTSTVDVENGVFDAVDCPGPGSTRSPPIPATF